MNRNHRSHLDGLSLPFGKYGMRDTIPAMRPARRWVDAAPRRDHRARHYIMLAMTLKRLELAWRRLWIRVLVKLMRTPATGQPDWGARPHRVLFLRHDRAGDMILSTGVVRAIARSHPTITLDVLASPANARLLDAADYVRDVIVFDKRRLSRYPAAVARLRRGHYDAVIDCMVTAPSLTTLLLILGSGARYRV